MTALFDVDHAAKIDHCGLYVHIMIQYMGPDIVLRIRLIGVQFHLIAPRITIDLNRTDATLIYDVLSFRNALTTANVGIPTCPPGLVAFNAAAAEANRIRSAVVIP